LRTFFDFSALALNFSTSSFSYFEHDVITMRRGGKKFVRD
jgi:hypothetical protein